MIRRLKILLFLFLLPHSNCFRSKKRNSSTTPDPLKTTQRFRVTTELHKIIRWKSQPAFYTAPMEYQEIVGLPTTEEVTTEKTSTVQRNITARSWSPMYSSSPSSTFETTETPDEHRDGEPRSNTQDLETTTPTPSNISFEAIMKEDISICAHFKYGKKRFDLEPMADVWQTVYFSLPDKIQCFKILIKRLTEQEKEQYSAKYGSFNGIVNWAECNLEIWSAIQNGRRHFLQGLNEDDGIMDNIVIEEPDGVDAGLPTIHEESADQWLVYKNLLLLRDCDTGGVVVFAKIPSRPSRAQIEEALEAFGETVYDGQLACEDDDPTTPKQAYYEDEDANQF